MTIWNQKIPEKLTKIWRNLNVKLTKNCQKFLTLFYSGFIFCLLYNGPLQNPVSETVLAKTENNCFFDLFFFPT